MEKDFKRRWHLWMRIIFLIIIIVYAIMLYNLYIADNLYGILKEVKHFLMIAVIYIIMQLVVKDDYFFTIYVKKNFFLIELYQNDIRRLSRNFSINRRFFKIIIKDKYGAVIQLPYSKKLWLYLNKYKI